MTPKIQRLRERIEDRKRRKVSPADLERELVQEVAKQIRREIRQGKKEGKAA